MSSQARVTVIIPVFNRCQELRRALDSLCSQSLKSFRVRICDDGSTDEPNLVADEFAGRLAVELRSQPNSGLPASARNLGLRDLDTEFVAFLDSDDWWAPDKLLRSVEALDAGSDLVYHDLNRVENERVIGKFWRVRTRSLGKMPLKSLLKRGNGIATSSVVCRSSLVEKVGLMNEAPEVRAWEDFEYWLRVAESTNRLVRIRGCLGYYAVDSTSLSNSVGLLKTLCAIESRYFEDKHRLPAWLHFGFGVAHFRAGERRQARRHLFRSLLFHGSPRLWIEYAQAFYLLVRSFVPDRRGTCESSS